MASRALLLLGSALCTAAIALGCSSAASEEEDNEDALEAAEAQVDELKITTAESPSKSPRFDFCLNPAEGAPLHIGNAAWLALASANQYSHIGYFAPQLLDLGFGSPADSLWAQCGQDLGRARDFEIKNARELAAKKREGAPALVKFMKTRDVMDPENFGVCAREFLERTYTGLDPEGKVQMPAAAFKDYLIRKTDDSNWIQFFSAKPYSLLEKMMDRGSTQVMIARHSTQPVIVVVFRGTEPPKTSDLQARDLIDLFKDLDVFKSDLENYGFSDGWGYAHRGFISALQSVDDTENNALLSNKLRTLTGGDSKVGIWITGHSLGGALATLFTARLLDRMDKGVQFNLRGLYTYGSPMVGNDDFKAKIEESAKRHGVPLVRFRNEHDAVTGVPGIRSWLNYHHVGQLAMLSANGIDFPKEEPTLEGKLEDHSITGLVGPHTSRKKTTGYYSRIIDRMQTAPAPLTACTTR